MIPITPGGVGTVDAFMIAILTGNGTADGAATAADLVWRASSFVPQIAIGVIALILWYRRAGKTFATTRPKSSQTVDSGGSMTSKDSVGD
jgi:Predicted integral membrane protein